MHRDYNFHVPPSQLPFFLVNIPPPGLPLQWNCSHITGLYPNAWESNGQLLMFVFHQLSQALAEQNSLPSHFSFMNFSWFLCIWPHSFRFFSSPHSLRYFSHPNMAWEHFIMWSWIFIETYLYKMNASSWTGNVCLYSILKWSTHFFSYWCFTCTF